MLTSASTPQKVHFFIPFRSSVTREEKDGSGGGDAIIILKHWRRGLAGQRGRERERERGREPRRILCRVRPHHTLNGIEAELADI